MRARSWLVLLAIALLAAGCRRDKTTTAEPAPSTTASARAQPSRALDVTFLVTSDAHFGFGGIEAIHEKMIPRMNGIAGTPYPAILGGGVVDAPRGLVITGDLTEWGKEEEWARFTAFYGKDGPIRMPVFEMIGNHDGVASYYVRDHVAERHDAGAGTTAGRFYSWDFDALHLVALGEAPDDEGLNFLARDLDPAHVSPDRPVLLFFHFPLEGPWSTGNWFGDGPFRDKLAKAIEHRKIIGIFHGHHHARGQYVWHGVDVYKPGPAKDGLPSFAVVHVTRGSMTVAWRDGTADRWLDTHSKHFD